jgi:hypothetical protein
MNTDYRALAGRISQTLADLDRVVARAELLMQKAVASNDDAYLDGVALNLHRFYTGIERIFEDAARTLEKTIPSGFNRHRDLLLQMSAEIASVRPAVITSDTRHCLEEYRGFRHVVRNIYVFNLKFSRLHELTDQLNACYQLVKSDMKRFSEFLERLSEE